MKTDKILCPWCGAEMAMKTVHHDAPGIIYARGAKKREQRWNAWTSCTNDDCGADGPIVAELESEQEAIEAARAAALRRYTPPLKPLSKLDAVKKAFVYREWKDHGVDKEPILLMYIWDEYEEIDVLAWQEFSDDAFDLVGDEDYGKDWRCWERKPTDEERSAAEWEK